LAYITSQKYLHLIYIIYPFQNQREDYWKKDLIVNSYGLHGGCKMVSVTLAFNVIVCDPIIVPIKGIEIG
jgi:hypothetical protein